MGTDRERIARDELAALLDRCCELSDAVRYFEGDELIEVLNALDSIRALMADNSTTLRAAVSR